MQLEMIFSGPMSLLSSDAPSDLKKQNVWLDSFISHPSSSLSSRFSGREFRSLIVLSVNFHQYETMMVSDLWWAQGSHSQIMTGISLCGHSPYVGDLFGLLLWAPGLSDPPLNPAPLSSLLLSPVLSLLLFSPSIYIIIPPASTHWPSAKYSWPQDPDQHSTLTPHWDSAPPKWEPAEWAYQKTPVHLG